MTITYDPAADTVIVTMPGASYPHSISEELAPFVCVTYDAHGRLTRISIFRATRTLLRSLQVS